MDILTTKEKRVAEFCSESFDESQITILTLRNPAVHTRFRTLRISPNIEYAFQDWGDSGEPASAKVLRPVVSILDFAISAPTLFSYSPKFHSKLLDGEDFDTVRRARTSFARNLVELAEALPLSSITELELVMLNKQLLDDPLRTRSMLSPYMPLWVTRLAPHIVVLTLDYWTFDDYTRPDPDMASFSFLPTVVFPNLQSFIVKLPRKSLVQMEPVLSNILSTSLRLESIRFLYGNGDILPLGSFSLPSRGENSSLLRLNRVEINLAGQGRVRSMPDLEASLKTHLPHLQYLFVNIVFTSLLPDLQVFSSLQSLALGVVDDPESLRRLLGELGDPNCQLQELSLRTTFTFPFRSISKTRTLRRLWLSVPSVRITIFEHLELYTPNLESLSLSTVEIVTSKQTFWVEDVRNDTLWWNVAKEIEHGGSKGARGWGLLHLHILFVHSLLAMPTKSLPARHLMNALAKRYPTIQFFDKKPFGFLDHPD
ncbi:hypothetical protein DL96DRAFT_261021 [Flagelloscypha sp. PMI_526]|nr:hypothetical protein DL96DRAFT_261021 [Flagelloscypha sp. PMI_526]